jgi:hypothetical protein
LANRRLRPFTAEYCFERRRLIRSGRRPGFLIFIFIFTFIFIFIFISTSFSFSS